MVAYDLTRQDWRNFRLDRLDDPRSTGERFRQRELPAYDAAALRVPTPADRGPGQP